MYYLIFLLFLSTWCTPLLATMGEVTPSKRIAFVIGNENYLFSRVLDNPKNDANAVAQLLQKAEFQVKTYFDTDLDTLKKATVDFAKIANDRNVELVIFYYAGHGFEYNSHNYITPISAKIKSPRDIENQVVDINDIFKNVSHQQNKSYLFILDACRNYPDSNFIDKDFVLKNLAPFYAPSGGLFAYSTKSGYVAKDGGENNSIYTEHLLRELSVPDRPLEAVFKLVRMNVRIYTGGQQIPWELGALERDIIVFPTKGSIARLNDKIKLQEKEIAEWRKIENSNDYQKVAAFLREFPLGETSELAQHLLTRLLDKKEGKSKKTYQIIRSNIKTGIINLDKNGNPIPEVPNPPVEEFHEFQRNYTVGDIAIYNEIDYLENTVKEFPLQVTKTDSENNLVIYNDGKFVSDFMGNITTNQRGSFNTPRQFYPAELYVGKRWETHFKQNRLDGKVYDFYYKLKIVARETITVPAGIFDTFRIEARGYNETVRAPIERTIWVAPGINADIAHETRVRFKSGRWDQNDRKELIELIQHE